MRYILDLLLLWKFVPVLLNFFDIRRVWRDVDASDNTVPPDSGTPIMGTHRVFATKEESLVAGAAVAYAVYNLLNGGR